MSSEGQNVAWHVQSCRVVTSLSSLHQQRSTDMYFYHQLSSADYVQISGCLYSRCILSFPAAASRSLSTCAFQPSHGVFMATAFRLCTSKAVAFCFPWSPPLKGITNPGTDREQATARSPYRNLEDGICLRERPSDASHN